MASRAYLKLQGQKQGSIKGSVTQKGRTGSISVLAVRHEVSSPRDATTGLPTGKRVHKPLVITKEVDQSTPLLYNALVTNELFSAWELEFLRPSASGVEELYYRIKLTRASIASIDFVQPDARNPEFTKYTDYEMVAFTYQAIEWTWTKGGITAADDWQA